VAPEHFDILVDAAGLTAAAFGVFTAIVWRIVNNLKDDVKEDLQSIRADLARIVADHVRRKDYDDLVILVREFGIRQGAIGARLDDQVARMDRLERRLEIHLKNDTPGTG